jgi:hypothetical protein
MARTEAATVHVQLLFFSTFFWGRFVYQCELRACMDGVA